MKRLISGQKCLVADLKRHVSDLLRLVAGMKRLIASQKRGVADLKRHVSSQKRLKAGVLFLVENKVSLQAGCLSHAAGKTSSP